jgi:hypothetical protein
VSIKHTIHTRTAAYGAETWILQQETLGKFGNMVLKKDGEHQLDLSCAK